MKPSKALLVCAVVCGLILIVVVAGRRKPQRTPPPVGLENVSKTITEKYLEYGKNTMYWSSFYHGSLCLAAFLSAAGGIILKLESILKDKEMVKKDIAAMCAGLAALLLTLSAT